MDLQAKQMEYIQALPSPARNMAQRCLDLATSDIMVGLMDEMEGLSFDQHKIKTEIDKNK